tara:strand:- start:5816 stop:7054 length:1239 start_codon:yes stop_codon:yes gene_type:complete
MLIKLGWKNIIKRPFSSGLSIVLLSSSIMIILLGILTMDQLKTKFNENANKIDLVVGAKGSRLQLVLCNVFHLDNPTGNIKIDEIDFLSKHPFIQSAVPISLGDSYQSYRIVGTELSFITQLYKTSIAKGRFFVKSLEVVVGANVAKNLNLKLGDTFYGSHGIEESIHNHDDFEYNIVGILNSSGEVIDNLLITSLESVWDVHPENLHKGSFDLREDKKDSHHEHHHKEEAKQITALLINYKSRRGKFTIPSIVNNKDNLMASEPAIEIQKLLELIQPAIKVITILAWFIFSLAVISMIITILSSMKDRRYEIAMMRVAGSNARTILFSILIEGFLVSFVGSLLGFILGHLSMGIMGYFLSQSYHYEFSGVIFNTSEIWLFTGTIIIGMVSALFPAISAYRIDISRTLKNTL